MGLCLLTAWIFYISPVRRIEKLNNDFADIHAGLSKTQKVQVDRHDELTEIAARINVLLETVKLSRQQLFLLSEREEEVEMSSSRSPAIGRSRQKNHSKLPDRIFFNEALTRAMSYAKRHNKALAVLIVDVANKISSSSIELEENIMEKVAAKFSNVLRNEDVLAKLDGNEFIVLLHDIGKPKFASAVAEKLLQALSEGICLDYKEISFNVNIGISICPDDAVTLENIIKKTYSALYKAKSIGSIGYQFYTDELDVEAREYIHIKNDLQNAITNNQLILYYQPKMDIKKGSVVGVETLIRWSHPSLGLLTPDKFMDVAEDSGLILEMGAWALREACHMNMYWQNEGYEHLTIAMNLSTKQFYDPDLLNKLSVALNNAKLNARYLELEISEETIMKDLEKTAAIMKNIVELGVQISIDHFGKGYTSISHLKHLPVTTIKIDRGFVKGLPFSPNDCAITNAIIALVHHLGISALAEGVESAEQLQYLSQQNCDMVQGYFLSYPLPAETIIQQFKKISDRALG